MIQFTPRVLPVLCLLMVTSAFAVKGSSSHSQTGTIRFTGKIVEPICDTFANTRQQQIEMRCQRSGVASVQSWSLSSLAERGSRSPYAAVNVRYLDVQHKLAVLNVSYY